MKKLSLLLITALTIFSANQSFAQCNAQFTAVNTPTGSNPFNVTFTNSSTANNPNPSGMSYNVQTIDFGDNTSGYFYPTTMAHNYNAPGTYTVRVVISNYDSTAVGAAALYCSDTAYQTVTIAPVNEITGYAIGDTVNNTNPSFFARKIWLIDYDTVANTLIAIDSVITPVGYTQYTFQNVPPGYYLVKATVQNQTPGQQGWLPTYHYSSLYWNNADAIAYQGGISSGNGIYIQAGIALAGPGFIGGSISSGAGKGTGTGVPNMLVFLRNNTDNAISSTYTDNEGKYSFSDLPAGTYNIYPEDMGYETIPYNTIQITTDDEQKTGIDFVQTDTQIKPKTTGIVKIGANDGIKIYPNPANNKLFIENNNATFSRVTIVNVMGQSIKSASLQKGLNVIQLTDMSKGIYYLIAEGKDGKRQTKIVKE